MDQKIYVRSYLYGGSTVTRSKELLLSVYLFWIHSVFLDFFSPSDNFQLNRNLQNFCHLTMSTGNPKADPSQVGNLLQELISRKIEASEAIPIVKLLIQSNIFSLNLLNSNEDLPPGIPHKIRSKLVRKKRCALEDESPSKRRKQDPMKIDRPVVSDRFQAPQKILVNRSPVLTLWSAVVATVLHKFEWTEALSVGAAVSAFCAASKGKSLGIYESQNFEVKPDDDSKKVEVMGFPIHIRETSKGRRALGKNEEEQDPHKTWKLLKKRFGSNLAFCHQEMERVAAQAQESGLLQGYEFAFYEHIRPSVPKGAQGWGAHGELNLKSFLDFPPFARGKR